MKLLLGYMAAAAVLMVLGSTPADAKPGHGKKHRVPEPATMGVLGALALGSLIAGKIIRRK